MSGTSLQMIPDAVGVTKATLFYQFRTKEDIVQAAAQDELARLEAVVDAAEAERTGARRRQVLLRGMVDLSVDRRRTATASTSTASRSTLCPSTPSGSSRPRRGLAGPYAQHHDPPHGTRDRTDPSHQRPLELETESLERW